MGVQNIYEKLGAPLGPASAILFRSSAGAALGYGTTVPTAAGVWAPGAIFIHTDGDAATRLYVNNGTKASPSFVLIATSEMTGTFTWGAEPKMNFGNGAAAASGNVATEFGTGMLHHTRLALTNVVANIADGAPGYGGVKIYDYPQGAIYELGAFMTVVATAGAGGISDTATGKFGLGQVVASGALGTTSCNMINATNITFSGGVVTCKGQSRSNENVVFDGTTSSGAPQNGAPVDVYLNFEIADAGISALDTISCTGTVDLFWVNLGDN